MKAATLAALAAAGLGALVSVGTPSSPGERTATAEAKRAGANAQTPAPGPAAPADRTTRSLFGGNRAYRVRQPRYPRSVPQWTNARYRRAAQKKRNQARNRRAHRG